MKLVDHFKKLTLKILKYKLNALRKCSFQISKKLRKKISNLHLKIQKIMNVDTVRIKKCNFKIQVKSIKKDKMN